MAPSFFSIHKISTGTAWPGMLLLVALLASCTRDSGGAIPDKGKKEPIRSGGQEPDKETPAQLSYRLRPRLEVADPSAAEPEQDLAPLLSLAQETPLRVRIVLGYGGIEKLPSSKQLAAIKALGTPLWSRIAQNLGTLQRLEPPILPVVTTVDGLVSSFKIPIDRPGAEALILLPELWDILLKFDKPLVAALPSRDTLLFIIDEPENIKLMGNTLQEFFEKASAPMINRFLIRKGGKLLPGKTFEEAGKG